MKEGEIGEEFVDETTMVNLQKKIEVDGKVQDDSSMDDIPSHARVKMERQIWVCKSRNMSGG